MSHTVAPPRPLPELKGRNQHRAHIAVSSGAEGPRVRNLTPAFLRLLRPGGGVKVDSIVDNFGLPVNGILQPELVPSARHL
jgi:hypothetical protein